MQHLTAHSGGRSRSATDRICQTHASDLPQLYRICLATADHGQSAIDLFDNPDLPGLLYMAPYVAYAPEHAFSLLQAECAVGYVVGTRDSHYFSSWLTENWWPALRDRLPRDRAPRSLLERQMRTHIIRPPTVPAVADEYPAHLHINLLPTAQGNGRGRRLMTAFLDSLRQQGVNGVHLTLSADNKRALGFYRKVGFREWPDSEPGSITMVQGL